MNAFRWGKTSNSPLLLSGNSIDGQSVSLRMSSGFPVMVAGYPKFIGCEITIITFITPVPLILTQQRENQCVTRASRRRH